MSRAWEPARFREAWERVMASARPWMSRAEIERIAEVSQSTISRWSRGDTQPAYLTLRRLADGIAKRCTVAEEDLRQLFSAAGYGDEYAVPAAERDLEELLEKLAAVPHPGRRSRLEGVVKRELANLDLERSRRIRTLLEIVDLG